MTEFKKHLTFKILTNLLKIPVNLTLNAMFPRLLGPINYGNFDFLYDSANKVIGFFDTGSSIAFYTRLSQNYDERLIKFYWWIVGLLGFSYFLFVFGMGLFGYTNSLWPNQSFYLVFLSTVLGVLTFLSSTLLLIMDASNLTVKSEKVRMAQLVISFLIYGFLFLAFNHIELSFFFYIQCFLIVILIVGSGLVIHRSGLHFFSKEKLSKSDIREYSTYFWKFSNPLLVYSIVSLLVGIGARWILQQYGGSIEQAYFGLASKIGSFILIFTTALMPLLMREFSKLFGKSDFAALSRLYVLSFKGLYIISMFISVLVFFNADFISSFLGGAEFKKSTLVLSIMAFYPVHQSVGQINGSFFYSTQRNKEYRNVGLFFMPLGLILSFFLIAPSGLYGLNLGAKGLAVQMVLIQILTVNANSYLNCRFFKIKYRKLLIYQIVIPLIYLSIGFVCNVLIEEVTQSGFFKFFLFGAMLSILTVFMVYLFPIIIGFENRTQMLNILKSDKINKNSY
jgi:O-antigen/teichoic acid export membrane protein